MDRRAFIRTLATAGAAGSLAGCQHFRTKKVGPIVRAEGELERRALGATGERVSMIGFGGIIVMNETPEQAANYVAEAVDFGVNYFDVAPTYGNAEERLGPALKPWRDRCFLACKTHEREGKAAEAELHASLKRLETDHFDLYQLHAITDVDDVEKLFRPAGVMDRILAAREAGKIRFIGFSAHSPQAAHFAMSKFPFDTILFPFSFVTWFQGRFGPTVHERARKHNMGLLALKSMAFQRWPEEIKREDRRWQKCWYQPLDTRERAALGLRFTLGMPVHAALPPGHWELFKMAVDLARAGELTPLRENEREQLRQMASSAQPIFSQTLA